jgi:hypothetical protein
MIKCAHKDCGHEQGWTHKGGEYNKFIDLPAGDFYEIFADFTKVSASRFHGENCEMKLLGCPKCYRTFISDGESYLDNNQPNPL